MPPTPWTSQETVRPAQAFTLWQEHRARFETTGLWPLILSDPQEFVPSLLQDDEDPGDSLAVAALMDIATTLQRRTAETASASGGGMTAEPTSHPSAEDVIGSLVGNAEAWIVLVPCRSPAEVLASVYPIGGDSAPNPAMHVAVVRDWNVRYGAEPVMMAYHQLVLRVRPLTDAQEARQAARDWAGYVPDGADDPDLIAPHLIGLPVWPFWWD